MSANFALAADWVLTTGARYTVEDKDVRIATLGQAGCVVEIRSAASTSWTATHGGT